MSYPCWCYVKWLCCPSMVTLISCSYALLFHYVILLWLSSSLFKLNLTLIELEQICWLSHGATESSSPVQPHLPGWGGPNAVYCHASRRCLLLGKVMGARYPDQVDYHKPWGPKFWWRRGPRLGRVVLFGHDGGSHRGGGCHELASG